MGQYWIPVNLTKKEFVHPHRLGSGMKLWEQLANAPGTQGALVVLLAAMPETRGGGDLDLDENWHGPERTFPEHNTTPGPMPEAYRAVAKRTIGRWAGDRIAFIGDYAEAGDLPKAASRIPANKIYERCRANHHQDADVPTDAWLDVSDDVARVIEHELGGTFEGDGWRKFKREGESDD